VKSFTIELPGGALQVRVEPLGAGNLGYFDEARSEIWIGSEQPEAGQHVVLLRELIRAVDWMLVCEGLRLRRTEHSWIEHAAPNLLAVLILASKWTGLGFGELSAFMEGARREDRA
jgi:hypothetical protein